MIAQWIYLVIMLFVILLASMLFTNSLEYFGEKLGISEGFTGSISQITGSQSFGNTWSVGRPRYY